MENKYYIFKHNIKSKRLYVLSKFGTWGFYSSSDEIEDLILCLTDKGQNEKKLIEELTKIIKEIKFNKKDDSFELKIKEENCENFILSSLKNYPSRFTNIEAGIDIP